MNKVLQKLLKNTMCRNKRANKTINIQSAQIESLEQRTMLSGGALVQLAGDQLVIVGTNDGDVIDLTQQGYQVVANVNGEVQKFSGVQRIVAQSMDGNDSVVAKLDDVQLVAQGGDGDDELLVVSSNVNNIIQGGNGDDLVSSTGQGSDVLTGGDGQDTLYGIVGSPNVVLGGDGADKVISRDGQEITDKDPNDTNVSFRFDRPLVDLRDGVLYLMGSQGQVNDLYGVAEFGDQLLVVSRNQNGLNIQTFDANKVDAVAGILLGGDDSFLNLTDDVDSVFYGASGNDFLSGGGAADVLKGGSGNDLIFGNGGDDFVTGDPGKDVLFAGDGDDFLLPDDDDPFFNLGDGPDDERDYVDAVFANPNFLYF